jgi:hypothetical protein
VSLGDRLGAFLEWPRGVLRLGVVLVVAVVTAAAVWRFPAEIRDLGKTADANASLSYADRDVAAGNGIFPEQEALYQFAGRIPRDATYRVSVGPSQDGWTDLTRSAAEPFLHYWLLPRRPDPAGRWIVCIGCDASEYVGATEEWSGEAGISLLHLGDGG